MSRSMTGWTGVVMGVLLGSSATVGHANGYRILGVRSTRAIGQGEAVIARADDPSAVAFNPAGLPQLDGHRARVELTLCNAYIEHRAPDGTTTDIEDDWQPVPAVYLTSDLGRDDLGVGLGVSFPNGLASEWSEDSFARYVATYSDLVVADISPAAGVRVGKRWMVGAAANFYYSTAKLESMLDLGAAAGRPGTMDARQSLEGDGTAWGFALGAICVLNERHRVGAAYRHGYSIDYDGDVTARAAGLVSDATTTVDFPATLSVGYAFLPTAKWTLEVDADWTDWDSVDDIEIDFDAPFVPDRALEQDLDSTVAWKLGVEYAASDLWTLRAGYIRNHNATPQRTWRPSLVDTDAHFLTGGASLHLDRLTLDGALQLVLYEERTIDNNVDFNETFTASSIDGTYEGWAPCVSLAATYHF